MFSEILEPIRSGCIGLSTSGYGAAFRNLPNNGGIHLMTKPTDTFWNKIGDIRLCMLVTNNGAGLRARPMAAIADEETGMIRFIANQQDYKDNEINNDPEVCLTFADNSSNTFVSVTGTARMDHRPEMVRQHWVSEADAYFEHGSNDPDAILIEVMPRVGEYWDGPGAMATAFETVRASVTGDTPEMGENQTVRLS